MKEFCQKHLKKFVYFLQIISSIVLIGAVYIIGMIPMNYIVIAAIVLLGLLIGEYFLIFYNKEKSKRSLITQIFSVLLSCLFVICSFYVYKVGRTVDMMAQGGFQTRAISVIVLKDSQIKNETQLHDHQIGYMPLIDTQSMQYAIEDIHKNVGQITTKEYEDPASLVNSLYQKDVDAIILDEAFRSIVEQDNPSFSDDTRVIYQVMRDEESVASKSVEVTEKAIFSLY